MKKVLFLLPLLAALFFVGCSSDDEPQVQPVNIALSKTEISISTDDETNIEVVGADVNECTVSSEDEFIAYAMIYEGKINIEAEHVGETTIIVKAGDAEAKCTVSVTPLDDYVGSTVTEWGITYDELKEMVEQPYDSFWDDTQRGSKNFTYTKNGYKVTNRYYFENNMLSGVEKVLSTDSDSDTFTALNITSSLREYSEYENAYTERISNAYPQLTINGYIFSYPQKYYAVYEQTRYDILWETGSRPSTTNVVYFAKDLDTAKEHKFTLLN